MKVNLDYLDLSTPSLELNKTHFKKISNATLNLETNAFKFSLTPEVNLGVMIGKGLRGCVFQDYDNEDFVYKIFRSNSCTPERIEDEISCFKKIYGENSVSIEKFIVSGENEIIIMKLLKIPGVPLLNLKKEEFPNNAKELFLDMIVFLKENYIIHDDLHYGNILYDSESDRFWPIDINNCISDFSSNIKEIQIIKDHSFNREIQMFLDNLP